MIKIKVLPYILLIWTSCMVCDVLTIRPESNVMSNVVQCYQTKPQITMNLLVKAVIQVESNGRRRARGRDGERGLMQVTQRTWNWTCRTILRKRIPWKWAYNEQYNKMVGCAYLEYLYKRCGNWDDTVRAYNKGYNGMLRGKGYRYLRKIKRQIGNG